MRWPGEGEIKPKRLGEIRVILIIRLKGKVSNTFTIALNTNTKYFLFFLPLTSMINISAPTWLFLSSQSLIKMLPFLYLFSFSFYRGLFFPFLYLFSPQHLSLTFKSNIMWVYKSANETALFCLLVWSLKLKKEKLYIWWRTLGQWTLLFFSSQKHFIGAFTVFCPIHQRTERAEKKKEKRTPSTCLACNNFFDDGSIKWKMNPMDPKKKERYARKRW